MVLADFEIEERVTNQQMIHPFHAANSVNCRYNLRAGKVYSPETGEQILLNQNINGRMRLVWEIKPSETVVIMTTESVKIPNDLMAIYGQLNRLAQKGLLLINASIVEPGYNGPLSCFVVNFSQKTVYINHNEDVAKISFHILSAAPQKPVPYPISVEDYEVELAKSAAVYPKSFMNIAGVEDRVTEIVGRSVNKSVVFGGLVVAFLLLWSTLQPIFTHWIWETNTVASGTQVTQLLRDLDKANAEYDKKDVTYKAEQQQRILSKKIADQNKLINSLKQQLKAYHR